MNSSAIRIQQECASTFERTHEVRRTLIPSPGAAFEFLDDPRQLISHMGKYSWMMPPSALRLQLNRRPVTTERMRNDTSRTK